MSNLSDIKHLSDTLDTYAPAYDATKPASINAYPLLGLALMLSSAALTCCGAWYFMVN